MPSRTGRGTERGPTEPRPTAARGQPGRAGAARVGGGAAVDALPPRRGDREGAQRAAFDGGPGVVGPAGLRAGVGDLPDLLPDRRLPAGAAAPAARRPRGGAGVPPRGWGARRVRPPDGASRGGAVAAAVLLLVEVGREPAGGGGGVGP